jgi:hypothetical protein
VAPENERYIPAKDPRTSKVELGEIVPIPTWALLVAVTNACEKRVYRFFIENWNIFFIAGLKLIVFLKLII